MGDTQNFIHDIYRQYRQCRPSLLRMRRAYDYQQ